MKVNPRDESNGKIRAVTGDSMRPGSEPARTPGTDSVRLSGELKLAEHAVRAAALAVGTRPEAVARAQALLATGELGSDVTKLADVIIDSLLETRERRF